MAIRIPTVFFKLQMIASPSYKVLAPESAYGKWVPHQQRLMEQKIHVLIEKRPLLAEDSDPPKSNQESPFSLTPFPLSSFHIIRMLDFSPLAVSIVPFGRIELILNEFDQKNRMHSTGRKFTNLLSCS